MILQIWQSIPTIAQQIIVGLIVVAIAYVLAFPVRRFVSHSQEQKSNKKKRLRLHFKELSDEVRFTVSGANITEMYGAIVASKASVPLYHPDIIAIELPKFSESFAAHFPKENDKWVKYIGRILEHNEGYRQLLQKIRHDFESRGIPVVNIQADLTPCVYDALFHAVFNRWKELARNSRPWPDFEDIEQIRTQQGRILLYAKGWGSQAIASVENEGDKGKYERALCEVAENKEYEKEAAKIVESANERVAEIRTFKKHLIDTLDDIDKFWPGTKKYRFKETKNCSRCKELFH